MSMEPTPETVGAVLALSDAASSSDTFFESISDSDGDLSTPPAAHACTVASPPVALESFCGCARMTKHLRSQGFDAIGIDYASNKDRPESKVYWFDVTCASEKKEMIAWIKQIKNLKWVHFAPPCGTASRAREVRRNVPNCPRPLRSDELPDGLPDLSSWEQFKVSQANLLYKATVEIVHVPDERSEERR